MNVLVVDDDREIVESICIFLSGEGYKPLKAYDGMEALDILSENEVQNSSRKIYKNALE